MISYTTPTYAHTVKGIDLTECQVYVTYKQGIAEVSLQGDTELVGEDTVVTVSLTQEQTAKFRAGELQVQINWVYPNGKRNATVKRSMQVDGNLMCREVGYA